MKLRDSAERRLVTILHCDLVNSTQLVDRLDPEEFLGVVEQFLDMTSVVVEDFHGTVAGFTGDGIEAYFGYPVTTETPAVDAIFAALRIRNSLISNRLNLPVELECRVGVATGIAVVGIPEGGNLGRRLMAFGSVAHLAERLQSAAKPNQVFIDSETRKLSAQNFNFFDVGAAQLKGFEEDVEITEVIDQFNTTARFDYSAQHAVPITGRQHVLNVLHDRWEVASRGDGQIVHLVGDAGIGKSRVLHEFQNNLSDENLRIYHLQCSSQHASSPLHPWIHYIPSLAKFNQSDNIEQRTEKTRVYLADRLELPDHLVELSMSLLGIGDNAEASVGVVPPTAALSDLHHRLAARVVEESRVSPVMILFEDIQWIDATSSSWLELIVDMVSEESVLIGVTSRQCSQLVSTSSNVSTLSLAKLSNSEVHQFITRLTDKEDVTLSAETIEQIVDRSDGNPLYIEELTSMFLDQSSKSISGSTIGLHLQVPITLQMSLLARIDRIKRGRELAQIAAVIGVSFTLAQMENLTKRQEDSVSLGLSELVSSNVLRRTDQGGQVRYEFRHSLLQDAIYSSLLNKRREQIHSEIARDLQNSIELDGFWGPDVIAYHFDSANDWSGAFNYWVLAGERALNTGATSEAITLLEKAFEFIDKAKSEESHLAQLQRLHMAYGMAINAVRGAIADPGAQFKLASEVGEQLDDIELTVAALDWQFGMAFNSGQLKLCTEPAERLIQIGQRTDNPLPFIAGSQALGLVYFNQGRFQDAVDQFDVLFAHAPNIISGQHCHPSLSLTYFAWAKCMLGDKWSAYQLAERAIESAGDESPHAYTIALSNCSYVYSSLGNHALLESCNQKLNDHCAATGEFMYSHRAAMMRDYLLTKRTGSEAYLPSIVENMTALLNAKEEVEITYLFALLAELQIELKLYAEARESLLTGIGIANRNGEMFWYAQLNRLMAVVAEHTSPLGSHDVGPAYYLNQAITVASQQGAKAWAEEARQYQLMIKSRFEGVDSGMH